MRLDVHYHSGQIRQCSGNEASRSSNSVPLPVETTKLLVSLSVKPGLGVRTVIGKVKTTQGHKSCQSWANILNKCFPDLCRVLVTFHISEKLILTFFQFFHYFNREENVQRFLFCHFHWHPASLLNSGGYKWQILAQVWGTECDWGGEQLVWSLIMI